MSLKVIERKLVVADNTTVFIDDSININDRIIHLFGSVDDEMASNVIKGIQLMVTKDSSKPISIYINSFGGCPYAAFGIYDYIRSIHIVVKTYVTGCAMSGGSIIFMAGDERYMFPNAVLMLHSVSSIAEGKVFLDLIDETEECKRIHKQMCEVYAEGSNKTVKQWHKLIEYKDRYYRIEEALKIGLTTHEVN